MEGKFFFIQTKISSSFHQDSEPILQIAANYTQIHATVADSDEIMPAFHVTNHHLLTGEKFHRLLRGSKIFLGLGFPLEGPAPLEAGM